MSEGRLLRFTDRIAPAVVARQLTDHEREIVRTRLAQLGNWIANKTNADYNQIRAYLHELLDVSV